MYTNIQIICKLYAYINKLSIIIPLYNKSEYIRKAVDSVLQQSFNDFELIIVNDGSTDDSLEKVKQYSDSRIHIIDQKNTGVSTARNNGVKKAKHDLVAISDQVDKFLDLIVNEMHEKTEGFYQKALAKY